VILGQLGERFVEAHDVARKLKPFCAEAVMSGAMNVVAGGGTFTAFPAMLFNALRKPDL
jgi:hypothetical protein